MTQILDCPPSERKPPALSAAHFIEVFRTFYPPTHQAFAALDPQGQAALAADIAELTARFNRRPGSFVVPGEYLEAVIER